MADAFKLMQQNAIFLDVETGDVNWSAFESGNYKAAFEGTPLLQLYYPGAHREGFIRPPIESSGRIVGNIDNPVSLNAAATAFHKGILPTEEAALYQFYRTAEKSNGPIVGWNVGFDVAAIQERTRQYPSLKGYQNFFEGRQVISGEDVLFSRIQEAASKNPGMAKFLESKGDPRKAFKWNLQRTAKALGVEGAQSHLAHEDVAMTQKVISKLGEEVPAGFWEEFVGYHAAPQKLATRVENRLARLYVNNKRPLAMGAAALLAGTALMVAVRLSSGKREDRQTQISGLSDTGIAPDSRHAHTDFGSGYQGPIKTAFTLNNELIDSYIHRVPGIDSFQKNVSRKLWMTVGASAVTSVGTAIVLSKFLSHGKRRNRQTQIEGLRHGGVAEAGRQKTDFGSGWRGLRTYLRYTRKNLSFGTVPGALAMSWKKRPTAFLGLPIDEFFPETGRLRRWLASGQDEAEDLIWNQITSREARQTQIEGLKHGGIAGARRKFFGFGSGWKGLQEAALTGGYAEIPLEGMAAVFGQFGMQTAALTLPQSGVSRLAAATLTHRKITASSYNRVSRLLSKLSGSTMTVEQIKAARANSIATFQTEGMAEKVHSTLRNLNRWHQATGMAPVAGNKEMLEALATASPALREEMLRHEAIHSSHFVNMEHPFFKQAEVEAGGLQAGISKALSGPGWSKIFSNQAKELSSMGPEYSGLATEGIRKTQLEELVGVYSAQAKQYKEMGNVEGHSMVMRSEPIAHAFQSDPEFLKRAAMSGVPTMESEGAKFSQVVAKWIAGGSHTAPGRSKSMIQALRDSGLAKGMRRALTAFGSGYQGPKHWNINISPEEVSHLAFRSRDIGELGVPAFEISHAQFTTLRSEAERFTGSRGIQTGAEQELIAVPFERMEAFSVAKGPNGGLWVKIHKPIDESAVMKAAARRAEQVELAKATERIMETGAGQETIHAGTSVVKAILKSGSKIIKGV